MDDYGNIRYNRYISYHDACKHDIVMYDPEYDRYIVIVAVYLDTFLCYVINDEDYIIDTVIYDIDDFLNFGKVMADGGLLRTCHYPRHLPFVPLDD